MPTIEIVCVAQTKPFDFSSLPFAVRSENKLLSHRGLFQSDFDKMQGCIYHLGNPDMRGDDDFGFFAYELISDSPEDETEDCLKFNDEFLPHVQNCAFAKTASVNSGRLNCGAAVRLIF